MPGDVTRLETRLGKVEQDLRQEIRDMRKENAEFRSKLPDIIRTAIYQRGGDKPKNGNGANYLFVIQGLIVTLILTIISGVAMRVANHEAHEGHPMMMSKVSGLASDVKGLVHDQQQMEDKLENFKIERSRINDNESLSKINSQRIKDISLQVNVNAKHSEELGHPHVQTEMFRDLKQEVKEIRKQNGNGHT